MDVSMINEITSFITTVGFPIVCVIFMWRKITDSDEKNRELLDQLTSTIKELTHYIKEHNNNDTSN